MGTAEQMTPGEAFKLAVTRAGTMTALGQLCDMSQQRISYRIKKGKPCPSDRVLLVEQMTGVSKHLLRPDIYGATPADLHAATGEGTAPVAATIGDRA